MGRESYFRPAFREPECREGCRPGTVFQNPAPSHGLFLFGFSVIFAEELLYEHYMPGVRSGVLERPVFVSQLSESLHDEPKARMRKRFQTGSLFEIASCRGTLAIVAFAQKKNRFWRSNNMPCP